MSEFRVDQVDHIEILVPDRYEAAAWYQRVFGLTAVAGFEQWAEHPSGPLMVSSDGGSTKLALFTGISQGDTPAMGIQLVAFRVSGAAFLAFLDRLGSLQLTDHRARTVTPELVSDHGKAFSIYFSDPWGNRFEITTYDHEVVRAAIGA